MSKKEKRNEPEAERWYNLRLGPSFSFVDRPSPKFCTLRYVFKPASIDKNRAGSLHKSSDNRVRVEFHNNQPGKPKPTFEGVSQDYTGDDDDAVLLFDGHSFRLERLHRAVKRLKHIMLPAESHLLPHLSVEVKRIDVNTSEDLAPGTISEDDKDSHYAPSLPNPSANMDEELHVDIDGGVRETTEKGRSSDEEFNTGIDMNLQHPSDMDDEIADVDVSDDVVDNGPNAAEALRAQVNAEIEEKQTSSLSDSSGSESSESESGSVSSSGSGSGSESESESSSSNSNSETSEDVDVI